MNRKLIGLSLVAVSLCASGYVFGRIAEEPKVQAFKQFAERNAARLSWWGPNFESKGEIFVQSEPVGWKEAYGEAAGKVKTGQRVRLGANFWTTIDISLTATIGGTKVEPGYYYVLAEKAEGDGWNLVLLDHKIGHEKKLDAFMSEGVEGGIVIPTRYAKGDVEDELSVDFGQNKETKEFSLDVAFGPHHVSAAIVPTIE